MRRIGPVALGVARLFTKVSPRCLARCQGGVSAVAYKKQLYERRGCGVTAEWCCKGGKVEWQMFVVLMD